MIHKLIQIENLTLSLNNKALFENFNCAVPYGSRIAIIGRNGCGKSTLLKIINNAFEPTSGKVNMGGDVIVGYIPQIIEDYNNLSGGERLIKAIINVLNLKPNVLLLDEPTNHLDRYSRQYLMKLLESYSGTLIIVSHDRELISNNTNTIWHIDNGKIHIFSCDYNDYIQEIKLKRASIQNELVRLTRQKNDIHNNLMQDQQRAAKSKAQGEKKIANRKWLKTVGNLKTMKAENYES